MSQQTSISELPPLVATSVVRGSEQGESHGGVYIIDPSTQSVHQMLDWDTADIDWSGRGWDRGLRGIAFYKDEIYIAASDELFVYDQHFNRQRSFRNPYLKHCHEIFEHRGTLYLSSTGFDSVLAFDLEKQLFAWGIQVSKHHGDWQAHQFDPKTRQGPGQSNVLHINNVYCTDKGLGISGLRTNGILGLGAEMRLIKLVDLPSGTHNSQMFADGVLFNDTAVDHLRYVTRNGEERNYRFPLYEASMLEAIGADDSSVARQAFGRGLCAINERLVAAGSSPSTVSVFDLDTGNTVYSVNFSMDIRNAIHGLEVWPFDVPETN